MKRRNQRQAPCRRFPTVSNPASSLWRSFTHDASQTRLQVWNNSVRIHVRNALAACRRQVPEVNTTMDQSSSSLKVPLEPGIPEGEIP
jgi:hypothetical protein